MSVLWNDPAWVRWQVNHQAHGEPHRFAIWTMKRMTASMRRDVVPAMRSLNRAMVAASESCVNLNRALKAVPS